MKIRAIIHRAEEGGYWAEVPALPGCITEGASNLWSKKEFLMPVLALLK